MESNVSRLVEFGLGKLVQLPNLIGKSSHESKCIIIHIILHTTHNVLYISHKLLHITHNIFNIIRLYEMKLWNHGLDIKTSEKRGLIIWDLN